MDKIFPVPEQDTRDGEGIFVFPLFDKMKCGYDGYTSLPEAFRPCEFIQYLLRSFFKVSADNLICRKIDKVPVVDKCRMFEVELIYFLLYPDIAFFKLCDEDEKGDEPFFVNL